MKKKIPTIKSFLFRFWPVLYIGFIWFIFAHSYFIKGLIPYPSKYQVTFFAPWSHYEKWWGPVKNNAMPDVITQIYPWKHFTIHQIKETGQIPFWNPYNFGGNPHVANFQSAIFSPFTLLFFLFSFVDAWSLIVLSQPLLAGLFMYLFLRELKVGQVGSVFGSVTFMFSGFMVVWMAYGTLSMALAFLPLALFALEKFFHTEKKRYLLLISFSLATSFFSGHFQTSLYVGLLVFSYLLYKSLIIKDRKVILPAYFFYFFGIAVSLLQIIPTIFLYQESIRSDSIYQGGGIPLHYLITMIAPDFYGNPVTRNDWFGTYAEWSSFVGIIPFIFTFIAFIRRKFHETIFFGLASMITLVLSTQTPVLQLLTATKIPVFATSIPSRIISLFSFSFAVLGAFGLDSFLNDAKKLNLKKYVLLFVILGIVLLQIWLLLFVMRVLPDDKNMLAIKNFILPTFLYSVFFGVTILSLIQKNKNAVVMSSIILLLLASGDSLRFASKWMPFDSRELVFPNVPVIDAMQKNIGNGRVFGNIGTEVVTYYKLPSLEGYDPLYVERFGEFIQSAVTGEYQPAQRSVVRLNRRGAYTDRVLDITGVTLIFHPVADTNQSWAYPVWQGGNRYTILYQDDRFQLFQNTEAITRAHLFYNYEVIADNKAIIKRFYSEDFDFRNSLILEEQPEDFVSNTSHTPKNSKAEIVSYLPNEIVISVKTEKPGLLFLSDTFYPKWKATVNGIEAKIYRADYTFRAVIVPAGTSRVTFYYQEY